ncbi:hypothetical protein BGZ58_002311, partial [Dissophora ornata]
YRIIKWLTWLKSNCGLRTEKFMVDCIVVETEATKAVFPQASTYYCHFHVGQLWEKHLRSSSSEVSADFPICILQGAINTDFRVAYYNIKKGLLLLALSGYAKKRKAKAMELDISTAKSLPTEKLEESKFAVKSFTSTGIEYSVHVDVERSLLLSCSCGDYSKHRIPCKHLFLVSRIYELFKINYTSELEPTQDTVDIIGDMAPPLEYPFPNICSCNCKL